MEWFDLGEKQRFCVWEKVERAGMMGKVRHVWGKLVESTGP